MCDACNASDNLINMQKDSTQNNRENLIKMGINKTRDEIF